MILASISKVVALRHCRELGFLTPSWWIFSSISLSGFVKIDFYIIFISISKASTTTSINNKQIHTDSGSSKPHVVTTSLPWLSWSLLSFDEILSITISIATSNAVSYQILWLNQYFDGDRNSYFLGIACNGCGALLPHLYRAVRLRHLTRIESRFRQQDQIVSRSLDLQRISTLLYTHIYKKLVQILSPANLTFVIMCLMWVSWSLFSFRLDISGWWDIRCWVSSDDNF